MTAANGFPMPKSIVVDEALVTENYAKFIVIIKQLASRDNNGHQTSGLRLMTIKIINLKYIIIAKNNDNPSRYFLSINSFKISFSVKFFSFFITIGFDELFLRINILSPSSNASPIS